MAIVVPSRSGGWGARAFVPIRYSGAGMVQLRGVLVSPWRHGCKLKPEPVSASTQTMMQNAMRKRHPSSKNCPQSDQTGDSFAWRAASARLPIASIPLASPLSSLPSLHPSIPPSLTPKLQNNLKILRKYVCQQIKKIKKSKMI